MASSSPDYPLLVRRIDRKWKDQRIRASLLIPREMLFEEESCWSLRRGELTMRMGVGCTQLGICGSVVLSLTASPVLLLERGRARQIGMLFLHERQ